MRPFLFAFAPLHLGNVAAPAQALGAVEAGEILDRVADVRELAPEVGVAPAQRAGRQGGNLHGLRFILSTLCDFLQRGRKLGVLGNGNDLLCRREVLLVLEVKLCSDLFVRQCTAP